MKNLTSDAQKMLKRAQALGLQPKDGKPLVLDHVYELIAAANGYRNQHAYRAALANREPAFLEQENPDEAGSDYRLVSGRGCWISMGAFSVHPYLTDEGVVVDVYPHKAEFDCIASTYAFTTDAEGAYCEHEEIEMDEALSWAAAQGVTNWAEQEQAVRMEWLRRFVQSVQSSDNPAPQGDIKLSSDPDSLLYAVYSPNESALNDGAGFWNNQEGWTDREHATLFSLLDTQTLNLPLSTGQDALWVLYSDAR